MKQGWAKPISPAESLSGKQRVHRVSEEVGKGWAMVTIGHSPHNSHRENKTSRESKAKASAKGSPEEDSRAVMKMGLDLA